MPEFNCPGCGRKLAVVLGGPPTASGGRWRPMDTFADSSRRFGDATQSVPEFTEAHRDTPTGMQSKEAHVTVPLLRTFITGGIGGVAVGFLIAIPGTPHNNFGVDFKIVVISITVSMAVAWFVFLSISDSTLWIREKIINKDLNNDSNIGKPPDHVEFVLKREDTDAEGDSWQLGKLPCPGGEFGYLQRFCQDIIDDYATFSEVGTRDGTTKSGANKYNYSPTQWEDLRAEFIKRGWAYWKNPDNHKAGTEFTRVGERMLREIAES